MMAETGAGSNALYDALLRIAGMLRPPAQPDPTESVFQRWYQDMARQHDLAPDPDSPDQFYDYRAAHRAGAQPDETGHWPSDFKKPGHPTMVVGGFHVQTGQRVPGTRRASEDELIALGWEPATAKQLARMPEPTR